MNPQDKLAEIEKSIGVKWQNDVDSLVWCISRVKKLTEALEKINTTNRNDISFERELVLVHRIVEKALEGNDE